MGEVIFDTENGIKIKLWWRGDGRLQLEHWDGFTWNDKIKMEDKEIHTLVQSLKYMLSIK